MNDITQLIGINVYSEGKDTIKLLPTLRAEVDDLGADEGLPRQYYLCSESEGIQIQHAESGEVQVIFLYGEANSRFSRYRGPLIGGLSFNSIESEIRESLGEPTFYARPQEIPGLGSYGEALRYDFPLWSVHFQMKKDGSGVSLVTIMAPDQVPGT